jgi:hypothetical protein
MLTLPGVVTIALESACGSQDAGPLGTETTRSGSEETTIMRVIPKGRPTPSLRIAGRSDTRNLAEASQRTGRAAVDELLRALPTSPAVPGEAADYIAFVAAYMEDEDVLPERDWDLSGSLTKAVDDLVLAYPREGVEIERLSVNPEGIQTLRKEFHGDGPLNDPQAEAGLSRAVQVLREAFETMEDDQTLVLVF